MRDPDFLLEQARNACLNINHQLEVVGKSPDDIDVESLVSAFTELDLLVQGGVLPMDWCPPGHKSWE